MKKLFALALILAICIMLTASVAYADEDPIPLEGPETDATETVSTDTTKLPKVYAGGTVGGSSRKQYTEKSRPADSSPLNSVVDNPVYGDEFNFLTVTNAATGDAWRAGTLELIPGDQYLIEVYCRNDCSSGYRAAQYSDVQLQIEMPYTLQAGEKQTIGARLMASTTINIYASVNVIARSPVSILYVDNTAKSVGQGGELGLDYEELFGDGANIIPYGSSLGAGSHRTASFVIQVVEEDSLVGGPAPDIDYDKLLSPAGTGFATAIDKSVASEQNVASADERPVSDEADTAEAAETVADESSNEHGRDYYIAVVIGAALGTVAIGAVGSYFKSGHGF